MRLGILNALSPDLDHIDWQGTPIDTYFRFFESVDAPFTYAGYDVMHGKLPNSVDDCDAYMITGSASGVYDAEEWIAELMQFIRDCYQAQKKLVGICFGHQVLAHTLGGHAEKSEKGWGLGLKRFDIVTGKPWMAGSPAQCDLYFAHQDQVTQIPPAAERLGGSEFCPNAFYAIENRVLGIQGHPEFTTGIMQDILAHPKETADPQTWETAVRSLNGGTPDNRLVAQWIVNFLTA